MTRGLFQLGVKQEKICLSRNFKQESVIFMPLNKEVEINNIKIFPVNWAKAFFLIETVPRSKIIFSQIAILVSVYILEFDSI